MEGKMDMTYVINPWFFYWIQVSDSLREALSILATLAGVSLFIAVAVKIAAMFGEENAKINKAADRFLKVSIILLIPLQLAYTLLPQPRHPSFYAGGQHGHSGEHGERHCGHPKRSGLHH